MKVISFNDYPHCLLEEGTTDEEALKVCQALTERVRTRQVTGAGSPRRAVYVHWRDCPVFLPEDVNEIPL